MTPRARKEVDHVLAFLTGYVFADTLTTTTAELLRGPQINVEVLV